MNWREYWNGPHPIYVNARHRALHFDLIARDIARLIPSREAMVLDYGCGEADTAPVLAQACGKLYLFDTASTVRERLRARHANNSKIVVLDERGLEGLAERSLDLIVVNSVLQYLSETEMEGVLDYASEHLKPNGQIALGDVIPADANAVSDTLALLDFALKGGFLGAALVGLARTAFSDYRKLRDQLGLTRYEQGQMLEVLRQHGFSAQRAPHNIGHNQTRMLFLASPAQAGDDSDALASA